MDLHEILEVTVRGLGFDLVDVECSPRGRVLRVFIDQPDKPRGVDVEDCAWVSNQLSHVLLVENVDYERLEVSSPGLDRLLRKEADFVRFAGLQITLKLRLPLNERRNFTGILRGVQDGKVRVQVEAAEIDFDLANIDKARLVPDFALQKPVRRPV